MRRKTTPAEQRLTDRQKKRLSMMAESGYDIARVSKYLGFRKVEIYKFAKQLGLDYPSSWALSYSAFKIKNKPREDK